MESQPHAMERKHPQSRAHTQGQKPNNSKATGSSTVQNFPEKGVQKPKKGANEKQGSKQSPEASTQEHNSKRPQAESAFKMNPNKKVSTSEEAEIKPKNPSGNKDKDKTSEKPLKSKPPKENNNNTQNKNKTPVGVPNGVKAKHLNSFANGHESKKGGKVGSGPKDGRAMLKNQKATSSFTKTEESLNLPKKMPPASTFPILQQGFEGLQINPGDQSSVTVDSPDSVWNSESWAVGASHDACGLWDMQDEDFKSKPSLYSQTAATWPRTGPTAPVVSKEEAWSLFKEPTVFPIYNSDIPKVTYASKVKENLHKVQKPPIPTGAPPESLPSSAILGSPMLMPSPRHAKAPVSSLQSVNSLGFADKPEKSINKESSQLLPLDGRLIKRPSPNPKSLTHIMNPDCPAAKPSLFSCPSKMPAAPTGPLPDIVPSQTKVKMLKKIFQNKWGLSFISNTSINPELTQETTPDPKVTQPSSPSKYPNPLASQVASESPSVGKPAPLPKVSNPNTWSIPQEEGDIIKPTIPEKENTALIPQPSLREDPKQAEKGSGRPLQLLPRNFMMENPESFFRNPFLDASLADLGPKDSRDSFDARAAVEYHITEMKSVWDMQKHNPQRIIIYDDSITHPPL